VGRLFPVALAFVLLLFVVACGGGSTEDTAPEGVEGTAPAETDTGGETETEGGETETETEGGGGEGDPEAGAAVYDAAGCANCHIYEPAGSTGTVGPNLDESDVDFQGAVEQITSGGGGMPAYEGQLSQEEIENVAAFVTQDSR